MWVRIRDDCKYAHPSHTKSSVTHIYRYGWYLTAIPADIGKEGHCLHITESNIYTSENYYYGFALVIRPAKEK